jgi:NadR type nicotinamide-nucleotide adenylyltransferase
MQLKKIVVVGPESTGKSTLCSMLAEHYKSIWVEEYAREYLMTHGTEYAFEDLYTIAQGQLKNEEDGAAKFGSSLSPLFIDTDMYVMKVWSEFVFNKCDNRILTAIATRQYDLYLLCNTDLPWVKDELREYPDLENRQKLYHYYHDLLVNQYVPWKLISGESYEGRFEQAVKAVEQILVDN